MRSQVAKRETPKEPEVAENTEKETLEGEVEVQLAPVLKDLNRVQREQILTKVTAIVKTEAFSGPLPHPRHLEEYNRIVPNGADRILKMTEKVIESNISVNERGQKYEQIYRMTGMILGFFSLMLLVVLAFLAGWYEMLPLAALLLGATVVGSIGMFIKGR